MSLRTSGVEGGTCQSHHQNALAQKVNRILSVPRHPFQCWSTSEKSIVTSERNYNILKCVDNWDSFFANVSAEPDLDLTKPSFGLTHVFPCFCWAGLCARFGLSHFFQCFGWARLGLDQAQFWGMPFYQCVFAWSWAVAIACVAHMCRGWGFGRICLFSSWRKKRMICNSCFEVWKSLVSGAANDWASTVQAQVPAWNKRGVVVEETSVVGVAACAVACG